MWRGALTAILLLGSTIPALAARIDIDDPALLGPVLISINVGGSADTSEQLITEVRYEAGIYSYVYAVQTSPWWPSGWNQFEGEPSLLSVAVTGHPLSGTWGAISTWTSGGHNYRVNVIESIAAVPDGFIAIPERTGALGFTVMYWQSPLRPTFDGTLTYTAQNYCFSVPRCFNQDGSRRYEIDSFDVPVFAPVPEPGSIALMGSGLVGLYATLRRRRTARP